MVSVNVYNYAIIFLCLTGLGVSIYAYFVTLNLEHNSNYMARCDISEHISCTKAFKSE